MSTRSILVRITGTPFSVNDLRPDTRLATIAARLMNEGHETTILDYGTPAILERLYPPELKAESIEYAERIPGTMGENLFDVEEGPLTKLPRSKRIAQHQIDVWEEIGEKIAARRDFDFVLVSISTLKDLAATEVAAKRIRALIPRMTIAACGTVFDEHPHLIANALESYDAVCLGTDASWFARLAEASGAPKASRSVPNIAYMDGARFVLTPPGETEDRRELTSPIFDSRVYLSIGAKEKIQVFDLDEIVTVAGTKGSSTKLLKSPKSLIKEMKALAPARAFHLRGCLPESDHSVLLARALLSQNMRVRYSREADVTAVSSATVSSLCASGMSGIDLRIDTGSQRLLDTHYGHSFCVTDIEQAVRRCKISNVFTTTRFQYPIQEDDYHTCSETLRLIERSKPDSTFIDLPKAQEHGAHHGLLFQKFLPFSKRSKRHALDENTELRNEVTELGITLDVSARFALLAGLAGYEGREAEFMAQLSLDLLIGDASAISSTVERINHKASEPLRTFQFKPFIPAQDAVAN